MSVSELSLQTIGSVDGFDRLAPEWDELVRAGRRPNPFLLHGWISAWLEHYGAGRDLQITTARRAGRLVGAFPLVVRTSLGVRVAQFVGEQIPFCDVILAPNEPLATTVALVDYSKSGFDCVSLFALSNSSALHDAIGDRLQLAPRLDAPALDISRGFEYVNNERVSRHERMNSRRQRRQLEALGKLEFVLARTPGEIDSALDDAFRLHELRWAGRYDTSSFATELGMCFHRRALGRLAEVDVARVLTLRLDGSAIAFLCYLALGGRVFLYRTGFDPTYNRCAPGNLIRLVAIEQAAKDGFTTVEFLGGAQEYKLRLADRIDQLYVGLGIPTSVRGAFFVHAEATRLAARAHLGRSQTLRHIFLERVGPALRRFKCLPRRDR